MAWFLTPEDKNKIRAYRRTRRITIKQLAINCGISQATLKRIMTDVSVTGATIKSIEDTTGLSFTLSGDGTYRTAQHE